MSLYGLYFHGVRVFFFFFQAEDGIRDLTVTGVQTCALPICVAPLRSLPPGRRLSLPPPRRAQEDPMSDAHIRRVQAQFGGSAAAYVPSGGHAGGGRLERLPAGGRACRPRRSLGGATGGRAPALSLASI